MSFRFKIILSIIITVFFSTVPLSLYLYNDGRKNIQKQTIQEAELISRIMARETLSTLLRNGGNIQASQVDMREMLVNFYPLFANNGLYFTELVLLSSHKNRNGKILAHFPSNIKYKDILNNRLSAEEIKDLTKIKKYRETACPGLSALQHELSCYEFVSYIGLPGKKPIAASHLYISRNIILSPLDKIERIFFWGTIIMVFVMSVFGSAMGQIFIRPIKDLISGVRRLDSGDLNSPVKINSRDEFGLLARSFNKMADNLRLKINELNDEIFSRKEAQETLQSYKNNLEEIVKKRTSELRKEVYAHRKTSKELIRAKEIAELANQAKSDFVSNMSHEIRTPMNAILGFTEILMNQLTDDIQKEYIKSIGSSGKILMNLINDMLDLAKIESGKMEIELSNVNPEEIIQETIRLFQKKSSEKRIELITDIDPHLPNVLRLDETRIRQILLNLLGNAVKFTESGFVRVGIESSRIHGKRINLKITVEDTGIGIPDDQQKKVFNSFVQVTGQDQKLYGGTGLGLTITKMLVELMGGTISLRSQKGKGSIFIVEIPGVEIASETTVLAKVLEIATEDFDFSPAHILIADDNEENSKLIETYLKGSRLKRSYAVNGFQALEKIKKDLPDLVLMDIKMPLLNGLEALKKIRENRNTKIKKLPVIMVTATSPEDIPDEFLRISNGLILKPINQLTLMKSLAEFIPHKRKKKWQPLSYLEPEDLSVFEFKSKKGRIKKWTALMDILDEIVKTRINALKDFQVMNDIESLAVSLIDIAEDNGFPELLDWAAKLKKYVILYDSDMISKMIKEFPEKVEDWKKNLQIPA